MATFPFRNVNDEIIFFKITGKLRTSRNKPNQNVQHL